MDLIAGAKIEAGDKVGWGEDGKVYPFDPAQRVRPVAHGHLTFAFHNTDGTSTVRLEAPTLDGLLVLMAKSGLIEMDAEDMARREWASRSSLGWKIVAAEEAADATAIVRRGEPHPQTPSPTGSG